MTSQVGIGTASPDPAAALDINSQLPDGTYGGLKLPTMTLADRATIATPIPDGLMIYILDGTTRCVQIWDATQTSWINWYCMNQLPVASSVSFSGTTDVGETLTGGYTYTDVENDAESGTIFQWYRATDINGTGSAAIAGATSINYVTTIDDGDQFVALGVTPQASSGASPGVEELSTYQEISFLQTLVEFDRAATTIPEGTSRTIPILITNPNPSIATTVDVAFDSGNTSTFGSLGTDYTIDNDGTNITSLPFTVTIPAGDTAYNNITITVLQDNENAIDEVLYLVLQNVSGGSSAALSGNQDDHIVYSDDDEFATEVAFIATASSVEEPLTPGNSSTIDVAITNPSTVTATTVQVTLNASSTVETGDYTINYDGSPVTFPFTVTFPAVQTANESFTITSLNDPDASDELLNIELTSPAGGIATAILGTNDSHDLTINDDDVATVVEFATSTFSINEDDIDTITINLNNPSATVATTVEVAIGASSTVAGAGVDFDIDYASTTVASYPFTVTFPAGVTSQTIDLDAYNDVNTANETLILNLQNVSGGFLAQLGTNVSNTVTINDDDTPAGPILLGIQDFETSSASPTLPYTVNTAGVIRTTNGTSPNSPTYIDARSYGVINGTTDLDFGPVNSSSYTDATLRFRLAAFSLNSTGNGLDGGDYVDIYISDDNGVTFSYELEITGSSNRRYDFNATGSYTLAYDGDNSRVSVTTPNGSSGYSYIEITGLPSTANLIVGIVMYNDNNNELWVIDNVELIGNP